ncbi:hypothetical protein D1872_251850 [compost metagenome]
MVYEHAQNCSCIHGMQYILCIADRLRGFTFPLPWTEKLNVGIIRSEHVPIFYEYDCSLHFAIEYEFAEQALSIDVCLYRRSRYGISVGKRLL